MENDSQSGAASSSNPAASASQTLAPETGAELRRLAHDLANALEVIIQATYLLRISNLPEEAVRWADMVDTGAQQAADLNRKLRDVVRSATAG